MDRLGTDSSLSGRHLALQNSAKSRCSGPDQAKVRGYLCGGSESPPFCGTQFAHANSVTKHIPRSIRNGHELQRCGLQLPLDIRVKHEKTKQNRASTSLQVSGSPFCPFARVCRGKKRAEAASEGQDYPPHIHGWVLWEAYPIPRSGQDLPAGCH